MPSDNLSLLGPFFSFSFFVVDQSHSLFHPFDKWILARYFSVDKTDRLCISVKYGEFSVNAPPDYVDVNVHLCLVQCHILLYISKHMLVVVALSRNVEKEKSD